MTSTVQEQEPINRQASLQGSKISPGMLQQMQGKWAGRFIWAAIVQGVVITIITLLILEPLSIFNIDSYFSPSMVIAAGGGGTWMFTGYILYLVVGVVAVAVTAIFYFYIEDVRGKPYHGLTSYLAWGHYVFMNVGVAGSMMLMIWGGYMAGYAGAAVSSGGLGYTDEQIHVHYLSQLIDPIGLLVLLAAIGAILGGLGFVLRSRAK
jgi:hypothetical protein